MGKHTPGPWDVAEDFGESHGQFSILDADRCELAAVEAWIGEHRAEATANARLIAAAPDLRSALQRVIPILETLDTLRHVDGSFPALDEAKAAIAKAEATPPFSWWGLR